jgi:formylglycine-generating enzyme required for sulfatase activity
VNPKDALTYVWIPPGSFIMGCSHGDRNCQAEEKPAHKVTLTKGFWIGQTPVTQAAYEKVIGKNPSGFIGPSLPVGQLDWDLARAYCDAVGMRLPTEAEWEYAARGGQPGKLYGELDAIAWYKGNSGMRTHAVATKQPNAFGLYDMLGNVLQWVADWHSLNDYDRSPAVDPKGPGFGAGHELRGVAYTDPVDWARVSARHGGRSYYREAGGVRCAGN